MHSKLGLQAGVRSLKVAVLDTIHGAKVIAQRMADSGIEAEALEVYHSAPSIANFDIVVSPVHLSPGNPVLIEARKLKKKIITHHQAVGELLKESLKTDLEIAEITGTHSKTSTALVLAIMLSYQKKVVSHTTRGIEVWIDGESRVLQTGLSITPGNVIPAVDAALAQEADALICEISLGGTGIADFGVLSSFSGDYLIAKGCKWATTAKLQMLSLAEPSTVLIANTDTNISANISFGPKGCIWAEPDRIRFEKEEAPLFLGEDLDFASYQTAISAGAAAAFVAGMEPEDIAQALHDFDGLSGRMKVVRQDGLTIYDNSNSGLKVIDVNAALDNAQGESLSVVVGEESEAVCEGMDIPSLVDLLRRRRQEIQMLILVGQRLEPWAKDLEAKTAPNLAAGIELARFGGANHDRLLLCVKCFR
jgi:coenzyme F430 synthetase